MVFERLFGDGGSAADRKAELRKNGSILDWVTEDMARLGRRLGPSDRTRVDEYLDTLREVERRIQKAEQQDGDALPAVLTRPVGVPADWEEHAKLMFDLQVLALQADITRVITFQLAREVSTRTYPQIGVAEPHHATSHHQNSPEKLAKLAKINAYHVSLFAYLLEKLQATKDGDGTLLDHSMYRARQRPRQSGRARPHEPADCRGGRRIADEGRAAHQVRAADAADEPACHAARQGGRADRAVCRQQRQGQRAARAAVAVGPEMSAKQA